MPQLEITELEAKALWIILDYNADHGRPFIDQALFNAGISLFDKVYRAYRGMPEKVA